MNNPTLIIDPEFHALIPPLSTEERAQLEENLAAHGCIDPLVVWQTDKGDVLLDGHNRHEICERRGIPFKVHALTFDDRESAADWIDANQLGRRNLTPDNFKLIVGRRYNRKRKTKAEAGAKGGSSKPQVAVCLESTAAQLGKEHGISADTVMRAGKFAEEVAADPELQKAVKNKVPVAKVKKERKAKAAKPEEEKPKENRKLYPVTYAKQYAQMAIETLKRILPDDTERKDGLAYVASWINTQVGQTTSASSVKAKPLSLQEAQAMMRRRRVKPEGYSLDGKTAEAIRRLISRAAYKADKWKSGELASFLWELWYIELLARYDCDRTNRILRGEEPMPTDGVMVVEIPVEQQPQVGIVVAGAAPDGGKL
ncbi:MAG: hypothetical protein NTX50_24720 [Candidatus Sumerlaeota bacterium]|nr:hypothetical protein [Candidatus Sumerlaeota bacterium]